MSILVIAEHDNQNLSPATFNTISASKKIGSDIDILVAGSGCADIGKQSSQIPDVKSVLVADSQEYKDFVAENLSALIISLSKDYTHIVAPSTTTGKNFMPRVAALLDVMQISDIIQVIDETTFQRPIYAGNALSTVKSNDKIKIITVRTTAFEACPDTGGSAEIKSINGKGETDKSKFIKSELSSSERPELTSAKIVIVELLRTSKSMSLICGFIKP